jgi:pyridoxine 4-dehydrogenase
MKTTTLNGTDLEVSAMGLGAMPLSLEGRPPRKKAIDVIHRALELGVRLIDTADSYCIDESDKHHNEELIAEALEAWEGETNDVVVATKGGLIRPEGRWETDNDPERLRQTIRESHEALGGDEPIDLWQLHAPGDEYTIEEAVKPAREAVEEGLIEYVGLSNVSVEQIERARDVVDVVSVQNQFNPWRRDPEFNGVLSYCEREDLTFLPWSPLGGSQRVSSLEELDPIAEIAADRDGVSVHQVVLAWLRSKSPVVLPIPGASRTSSIEDSVEALEVRLDAGEVERIDRLSDRIG